MPREESDALPFGQLINFSDYEGLIGPTTSKKLADDFASFAKKAEQIKLPDEDREWFLRVYNDFRRAFETAAQGGAVEFS